MTFADALLKKPLWTSEDAGKPIPQSPHALSICLPTWTDVIEYKEKQDLWSERATAVGHPRFALSAVLLKLCAECDRLFSDSHFRSLPFPSERAGRRAQEYVQKKTGFAAEIMPFGRNDLFVVGVPEEHFSFLQRFWQYTGQIVSSRLAAYTLEGKVPSAADRESWKTAKRKICERIADLTGEKAQNILLSPTGAAPLFTLQRLLKISFPDRKGVQFGFSDSGVLKIQQEFGNGAYTFSKGDADDAKKLEELLKKEKILGIFSELPGDPLLKTIDLERLKILSRKYTTPIIIDDTLGTYQNFKALNFADVTVASLSKFFSGSGDVTGGALVVNSKSRFLQMFARVFRENFEDLLWGEDAVALEEESRDFPERIRKIEATTAAVVEALQGNPQVYRIFTPQIKTPTGVSPSTSGVFFLLLAHPEKNTPRFYDALRVSKGPGCGTNFTLMNPYILFPTAAENSRLEKHGISPYLLRVSIGTEASDDLIARFAAAFHALSA